MKWTAGLVFLFLCFSSASAQSTDQFSRKNTWTAFAEFSNSSSHIMAGGARQRRLVDLGFGYSRRVARFMGSDLSYHAEVRPVLFESDPLAIVHSVTTVQDPVLGVQTFTYDGSEATILKCLPASGTINATSAVSPPEVVQYSITCGRQWTFGQAFAPFGFKYSVRTSHAWQPYLIGTLGYMYTSRPVPTATSEAFNFIIYAGAGIELYRADKKSVAIECRASHFSNHNTAPQNPGVDNLVFGVAYNFGH